MDYQKYQQRQKKQRNIAILNAALSKKK